MSKRFLAAGVSVILSVAFAALGHGWYIKNKVEDFVARQTLPIEDRLRDLLVLVDSAEKPSAELISLRGDIETALSQIEANIDKLAEKARTYKEAENARSYESKEAKEGVDALRDGVLWGYGAFALLVSAALSRPGWFERALGAYASVLPWFLLWTAPALLVFEMFPGEIPKLSGSGVPILHVKPGDFGVHLAGGAAFLGLGLHGLVRARRLPRAAGPLDDPVDQLLPGADHEVGPDPGAVELDDVQVEHEHRTALVLRDRPVLAVGGQDAQGQVERQPDQRPAIALEDAVNVMIDGKKVEEDSPPVGVLFLPAATDSPAAGKQ